MNSKSYSDKNRKFFRIMKDRFCYFQFEDVINNQSLLTLASDFMNLRHVLETLVAKLVNDAQFAEYNTCLKKINQEFVQNSLLLERVDLRPWLEMLGALTLLE